MINNDLQLRLANRVRASIDDIVDSCYETTDVFDEFCDRIDEWAESYGYKAYIRVFWNGEEDGYEMLDDVAYVWDKFNVKAYYNQTSVEYNATFTVMLYKKRRKFRKC